MNKKILFILPVIVILLLIIVFYPKDNNGKFYLDKKYYQNGEYIQTKSLNRGNYLVYVVADVCIFTTPCDEIFKEVMQKYKIDILEISFDNFKKTKYHEKVLYAPSVLIIKNGNLVAYLDAESDKDLEIYQNKDLFEEWLDKYIYLTH